MSTDELPELPIFGDPNEEGDNPASLPDYVKTAEFHEAWHTLVHSLFRHLTMAFNNVRSPSELMRFALSGHSAEVILIHAAHGRPVKVDLTPHLRFRHPVELPESFGAGMYVFVNEANHALCAVSWATGDMSEMSENSAKIISSHLHDLGVAMNLNTGSSMGHDGMGNVSFDFENDVRRDVVQEFRNELDTPIHEELIEQFRRELEGGES